ncbi:MAG: ABC transporter substrate-binding protein [Burkholderiales bacterium]|nr:ABC transporter substrate-binding protein [Burkholderiales bacterium]
MRIAFSKWFKGLAVMGAIGALATSIAQAQAPAPATLRLGMLPIVTQAPVFLGQERGFFKEEGLTLEIRMFQGGPEITAAAIGGDIDYGYANPVSPILAFAQGAPVRIIAPSEFADDSIVDGVLARSDGPIKGLRDLVGKRVAVNALKGVLELTVREGVLRTGGDPSKIVFVEAPFPQMGALLAQGRVDAVANVEPFITSMVKAGGAKIIANAFDPIKDGPMGIWFATAKRASDRELLERFRRAIVKSNIYASKNPAEVRRIIQTFTRITPEAAAAIALPAWGDTLPPATVQHQIDMLVHHKFLAKRFNASEILVK